VVTCSKFHTEDTHCTNFCCHGDLAPWICAPLVSVAHEHTSGIMQTAESFSTQQKKPVPLCATQIPH